MPIIAMTTSNSTRVNPCPFSGLQRDILNFMSVPEAELLLERSQATDMPFTNLRTRRSRGDHSVSGRDVSFYNAASAQAKAVRLQCGCVLPFRQTLLGALIFAEPKFPFAHTQPGLI